MTNVAVRLPVEDTLIANASRWVDHPSGFFALSSRNEHFSLPGVGGFVSYREWGKHLAVFGGVHAAPADREVILDAFIAHAESRSRRIVVVQLCASQTELFARRGFAINQFGTSYGIDLRRFTLRGTAKMQLRNKISRARKLGLRIAEIGREYPRSEDTFARLRDISTRWLRGKGKELDFMIGEIGGPEDTVRRIFVIVDGRGDLIGFITYVPVWGLRPGYLHDLTRRLPTAPAGAMELCNAFAIERLAAEGVAHLHFGFTPFITTGAEPSSANRLVAWTIRQLRKYGGFVYPAESQAQYKLKWRPDLIEPEYLAARPMSVRAVIDLLTLTRSL